MPIENFYYIFVCMKIGANHVDQFGNECKDPYWTIVDVNDKNKSTTGLKNSRFKIVKNGICFTFQRGSPSANQ